MGERLREPFVKMRCPKCGEWLVAVKDHDGGSKGISGMVRHFECKMCGKSGTV